MRYPILVFAAVALLVPAAALAASHGTTTVEYVQNPAYGATGTLPAPTYIGDTVPLAYTARPTTPLTVRVTHADGGLFCAKVADVRICSGLDCTIRKIGADGLCNFSGADATVDLAQPDVSTFATQCMNATSRGQMPWRGNVSGVAATAELRYKNGDVETVYGPKPLVALSCDRAECFAPTVGPYITTTFPPGSSLAPKATVGVPYSTVIWRGGWLTHWLLTDTEPPGLHVSNLGVLEGTLVKPPTGSRSYVWTLRPMFRCPSWDQPTTYPLKIELAVNDKIGPQTEVSFEPGATMAFEGGPMKLVAHVTDNWGVKAAFARFTFPDGHVSGLPLTKTSGSQKDQIWSAAYAELPNLGSVTRVVHVRVTAIDDDDNTAESADATYAVTPRPPPPRLPTRPPF